MSGVSVVTDTGTLMAVNADGSGQPVWRGNNEILYWDRDGFAVWAKRLEEGTYAMPFGEEDEAGREITAQELGALLSGIDLSTAKRRKRYRRGSAEAA
jgi:hypothetical protein